MENVREKVLKLQLGHLLDLQIADENNYFAAYNCGGKIHRIPSYSHLRMTDSSIDIINSKMGNYCKVIDNSNYCVLRNVTNGGFYLYNFITLSESPTKFSKIDFIGDVIKVTDVISDRVGELNIILHSCINSDGSFITPVFNQTENNYYDVADLMEYEKLKNNIRERLINGPTNQEIVKQLLLRKKEVK